MYEKGYLYDGLRKWVRLLSGNQKKIKLGFAKPWSKKFYDSGFRILVLSIWLFHNF